MKEKEQKQVKIISPERTAHLYALLAWNDCYTVETASDIVYGTEDYSELDKISYAESSIAIAMKGIKEILLDGKELPESLEEIKLENSEENYKKVVKILIDIHDNWVKTNPKKYNRGNEEKSKKKIYQHLPTALIGLDEVALDLMFLAPFLKAIGLNPGEMQMQAYGAFMPSEEIANAYQSYVKEYIKNFNISTQQDLSAHISQSLRRYKPLNPKNYEKGSQEYTTCIDRIKYMDENNQLLVSQVMAKSEILKTLPLAVNVD